MSKIKFPQVDSFRDAIIFLKSNGIPYSYYSLNKGLPRIITYLNYRVTTKFNWETGSNFKAKGFEYSTDYNHLFYQHKIKYDKNYKRLKEEEFLNLLAEKGIE